MASLQEQLMKAGLADEKKARAIRSEKRKQRKQQPKGTAQVNEAEERARKARQEQAERDRQLNLEKQKEAQKKAIQAQIRQLIETNRLDRRRCATSHQFVDGKKIKKLLVDDKMVDQLSRGRLAVVALAETGEVVADRAARKRMQREEAGVISMHG